MWKKKTKIKWKGRREPGNQGRETGRWKEASLSRSCRSTFCSSRNSACRQLPPLSPASPSTQVFSVWRRERITRECLTAHTDVTASPVVCHPHLNAQCFQNPRRKSCTNQPSWWEDGHTATMLGAACQCMRSETVAAFMQIEPRYAEATLPLKPLCLSYFFFLLPFLISPCYSS